MISARLNGLILAGGQSSRMGFDKSEVYYYDKPQRQYLAELLLPFCRQVFLSAHKPPAGTTLSALPDRFSFEGPLNGILTAFYHQPEAAWLTVPVDMPYIDKPLLDLLVAGRSAEKIVTCFLDSTGLQPEPLLAIWEPGALTPLKEFCNTGGNSPREFIRNNQATLLTVPHPKYLININTPEELEEFRKTLQQKNTNG
ncbi:MAG: NTP transferase domain-containing protein [Flammeovirgaceae bacterium]|nr:MAG: NTP transferase domain-containing protein [Flammeovirgaceae bacterium]